MSEEFKLPGSSYPEVSKIIQGYAALGKAASLADISKAIGGLDPTTISRNTGFLVGIGVLETGKNKAPTSLGLSLGNAISHDQMEEVRRIWSQLVSEDDFLKGIVSAIRIRKGMDENALRSHIAYSAGAKKSSSTTAGSGTVIEILKVAGVISEADGKYVVSAVSPSNIVEVNSDARDDAPKDQAIHGSGSAPTETITSISNPLTITSATTGGLAISINIEVQCDAGDLDTLGKKLRQVIDDLNSQKTQEGNNQNLGIQDDLDDETAE